MNLTEIQYGNPSLESLYYINGQSFLDSLFTPLIEPKQYAFPSNDSSITRNELTQITQYCGILQTDADALKRYQRYDSSLFEVYTDVKFETKEEAEEYTAMLSSVITDVLPLVFKLKHHWNRPRPFQLARYYKLKLFPFHSDTANNGAYPSAHACLSKVLATVLSNHYPAATKYFTDIAGDIAISRLYMGVNYPSSVEYGKMIADKIVTEPDFVKKYKL